MKQIMYIGKKPLKRDNVNDVPNRVWRGLGTIEEVTDAEAVKLTLPSYRDIWMDVTSMVEKERSRIVGELRERFRAEERAVTPAGEIARALNSLTTEELQAELRRRRKKDGEPDDNEAPAPQLQGNSQRTGRETEEHERPSSTEAVIDDIMGAIALLDKENKAHFDSQGAPILEAVREKLGYQISRSELDHAVKQIKG